MKLPRLIPALGGAIGLTAFFLVAYPFLAKAPVGSTRTSLERRHAFEADERLLDRARADWKMGKLAEAEALFRRVLERRKSDLTSYELAKLLMDQGKLEEAKRLFGYVMHPNGQHGSTYATNSIKLREYADLCKKVGDMKEARWALDRAGALIASNRNQRERVHGLGAASPP